MLNPALILQKQPRIPLSPSLEKGEEVKQAQRTSPDQPLPGGEEVNEQQRILLRPPL
jgi:hypothetical protein